jgi:two-component system response regulator VicR
MVPELKNKRVLVIENDDSILNVIEEALSYEGYEVNGRLETHDIFPLIEQYRPDVVILDYLLDGINGGEICHQIKVNSSTSKLPVILMSAYPRVLQSLGDYGCNKFIPKPFDLSELVDNIKILTS